MMKSAVLSKSGSDIDTPVIRSWAGWDGLVRGSEVLDAQVLLDPLRLTKRRPWKQRQAQVDGRRVQDAAGLSLFAVTGALKGLSFDLAPITAVLLGMLTGIDGGIARDILVAQVPVILRAELHAVAALADAAVVVVGDQLELPPAPAVVIAALICFGLRFMAMRFGWRLPLAGRRGPTRPG